MAASLASVAAGTSQALAHIGFVSRRTLAHLHRAPTQPIRLTPAFLALAKVRVPNAQQQPSFCFSAFKRNVTGASSSLQSSKHFSGVPVTSSGYITKGFRNNGPVRCMASKVTTKADADIIDKVKHDHEELEAQYSKYKKFHKEGNEEEAARWFNQFVWEISRHAVTEELVLYPLIGSIGTEGKRLADESRAEHQTTKDLLAEIQGIKDPEVFEKTFDDIMKALRAHIKKEESHDLEYLKQNVDQKGREAAGATFALGKKLVPTKPHPGVPNKSAALEAVLGLLLTPIDKLRDIFTPFPSHN